jgi:hypothetical protein
MMICKKSSIAFSTLKSYCAKKLGKALANNMLSLMIMTWKTHEKVLKTS